MNNLVVFLWLVEQDSGETILEQMWGSTSLGRGGAVSEMKEQFHSVEHLDASVPISLMERFLRNLGTSPVRIDVGQICCAPDDVFILIKHWREKTLRYTPQLVKTVVKEIMKVESSKQVRSLACCSLTIYSKSHLVAPAVSTEYPVTKEDAHRRLS